MAGYIGRILRPDERVIHAARIHWAVYLPAIFFVLTLGGCVYWYQNALEQAEKVWAVLFALFAVTGAIVSAIQAFLQRWTTELVITNRRVLAKIGFIRRKTWEINRSAIEGVRVDQSVLGRILGFGTIIVTGRGSGIAPIRAVDDPITFRNEVPVD